MQPAQSKALRKIDKTSSLSRPQSRGGCQFWASLFLSAKHQRALDLWTLGNGDASLCTLHVPSTRVRRSGWTGLTWGTWQLRHHHLFTIHRIISHARDHRLLLPLFLDLSPQFLFNPMDYSEFSEISGLAGSDHGWRPPRSDMRQRHRTNLVSFRLHVADVVFSARNKATVVL